MKWDMREHGWLQALLKRCIEYGVAMGLSFLGCGVSVGLALTLLGTLVAFIASIAVSGGGTPPSSSHRIGDIGTALFIVCAWMGGSSGLIGALGGLVAGFYSPVGGKDSDFYWCVFKQGRGGLLGGLAVGFLAGGAMDGVIMLARQSNLVSYPSGMWLGLALVLMPVGQIAGLWRGINLAIRQEREQQEHHA